MVPPPPKLTAADSALLVIDVQEILLPAIADTPAKVVFSCGGVPEVIAALAGTPSVLLAGIEAHVCVMQTALDLLGRGLRVFVAADAVASRDDYDREIALRRMERAGAVLTTAETAAFEWLGTAGSPAFKAVSLLVQDRSRRLRELGG